MCTALTFKQKNAYFGRTLDLEYHYSEEIVITPSGYNLRAGQRNGFKTNFSIIGIATVKDGYPLYYDAINECGLAMAGLNFVGNAKFMKAENGHQNIGQYELIPFILGNSRSVSEALNTLKSVRLIDTPYDKSTPVSELHYILTDGDITFAVEPTEHGFDIYDDPFGVLTNNPPFPYHRYNLSTYMNLTASKAENRFSDKFELRAESRGAGAFGLPGDLSSPSRFVRAAFAVSNAAVKDTETEAVGQVFHILDFVSQTEGLVRLEGGLERTQYAACANLNTGTYYYKTYDNSQICAVRLSDEAKSSADLTRFPLKFTQDIFYFN